VALARDWFAEPPPSGPPRDVQRTQGDRLTAFVREHPNALRYVARAAADPLLTAEELERWNHATNELFERGMYRLPAPDASSLR